MWKGYFFDKEPTYYVFCFSKAHTSYLFHHVTYNVKKCIDVSNLQLCLLNTSYSDKEYNNHLLNADLAKLC